MAERYEYVYETVAETNKLIREQQQKMAYNFPVAYAPEGRLRETTKSQYMVVMRMFYQFNRSTEDLTLELRQDTEDGLTIKYATVGTVYSADFFWSATETIRLHIIAAKKRTDKVLEHYHVYDMGSSGNAYSIPDKAWENWMMLGKERVGGVSIDKRLIYLAIGDRSQIGNMSIAEFSRLTCQQVESLQDALKPGMFLVRPSVEEAGLDEGPRKVKVDAAKETKDGNRSPSPDDDGDDSEKPSTSMEFPKLGGRSTLEMTPRKRRASFTRGSKGFKSKAAMANKRICWWRAYTPPPNKFMDVGPNGEMIPLNPDGTPMSKAQVLGIQDLFKDFQMRAARGEAASEEPSEAEEDEVEEVTEEGRKLKPVRSWQDSINAAEAYIKVRDENKEESKDESVIIDDSKSESFEEETSVEGSSVEMSGVSSIPDTSYRSQTPSIQSSEEGGPLPFNDSVEVFLAKKLDENDVVNVSTGSSALNSSRGQTTEDRAMGL